MTRMKSSLFVLALFMMSTAVFASGPTVYGLLNKEVRMVKQEEAFKQKEWTGATDVDGFESRVGVKGAHDLKEGLKSNYKVELGVNSNRDAGNGNRIRIRLAQVDLMGAWGKVTVGQAWTPGTLLMLGLDPLTATGAQALGYESSDLVGDAAGQFGSRNNLFKDLITYSSPSFHGLQAHLTQWKTSSSLDSSTTNVDSWYEATLVYAMNHGDLGLKAHFNFAKEDESNTNTDEDGEFWQAGVKATYQKFMLGASFGKEHVGKNGTDDVEYDQMLVGFKYTCDSGWAVAANYGSTDFGDKSATVTGDQTQWAIGPIYSWNKHVSSRLIYKNTSRESNTALSGTTKKNDASTYILGLTAKF